jgi:DNA-binding NtrC family response regulator
MRILVVDDQPDLLSITSSALESFGFDVLQAENGDRALDLLLDPDNVEILFTDVVMPGINGVELAHHARARHDGISVILTSGYPPPETVIPPTWQFLPKPYRFDDLLTAIRRAN